MTACTQHAVRVGHQSDRAGTHWKTTLARSKASLPQGCARSTTTGSSLMCSLTRKWRGYKQHTPTPTHSTPTAEHAAYHHTAPDSKETNDPQYPTLTPRRDPPNQSTRE